MCAIEIITGISKEEILEIIKDTLTELNLEFRIYEDTVETSHGRIHIEKCGKSHFGLKLYRVIFPERKMLEKFREKLMSKRAGG
ncbi:hypothetical protein [Geoglobus acetivorans]|uniref:Uncharacterized protein n=1 Tax=Geoglobus acetivorans TaxID=565033 RepID=A0A0A7GCF8_GEOAI|nr:hypothetical protein GACE_0479 [Geoglobus acetivorans]